MLVKMLSFVGNISRAVSVLQSLDKEAPQFQALLADLENLEKQLVISAKTYWVQILAIVAEAELILKDIKGAK
jgi:ABC-type transporter Mla subunit MlaD